VATTWSSTCGALHSASGLAAAPPPAIAARVGALLIVDEIQVGRGRELNANPAVQAEFTRYLDAMMLQVLKAAASRPLPRRPKLAG
jgi:hypothetical protein